MDDFKKAGKELHTALDIGIAKHRPANKRLVKRLARRRLRELDRETHRKEEIGS